MKLSIFKKGFTLIELLVVIAIIGILVAVGTSSYQRAVKLSRDSKRKADLEQIRQALETFRSETGAYPDEATWEADLSPDYIQQIPDDPRDYLYFYNQTSPTTYSLCAALELAPAVSTCSSDCGGITCNYGTSNP